MLGLNDLKIYIVSLSNEYERRSMISSQLDSMGLRYSFFDAVNPSQNEYYQSFYSIEYRPIQHYPNLHQFEIGKVSY